MAKIERTYNVPLRKEFSKAPQWKRSKKAVAALRAFLAKHMKSDNIKIGKHLNEAVWDKGGRKPPHHVKVGVIRYDDGLVRAELFGFPIEEKKEEKKKPVKKKEEKTKEEVKKLEEKPEVKKSEELIKKELEKLEEKTEKIKEQAKPEEAAAKPEEPRPELPKEEKK